MLKRLTSAAIPLAFVLLAAQNVHLLVQLRAALDGRAADPEHRLAAVKGRLLKPIGGRTLDGEYRKVSFDKPTIVISFSPFCTFSAANRSRWTALTEAAERSGTWQVLWLAREESEQVAAEASFAAMHRQILAEPSARAYNQLDMSIVPVTYVVRPPGRIESVFGGRLTDERWHNLIVATGLRVSGT